MALYTIDEIDAEIAETKAGIKRALQAHDYTNGSKRVTREMLSELRKHLRWLQVERDKASRRGRSEDPAGQGGPMSRQVKPVKLGLIDRALAPFAPGLALRRFQARAKLGAAAAFFGGGIGTVERQAASRKGRLGNWVVNKLARFAQDRQRTETSMRGQHLVANDPTAAGAITTMTVGTVGSGLKPQSRPKAEILGIAPEDAARVGRQLEFWWNIWRREADIAGRLTFDDIQFLNLYWMFTAGEYLNISTMLKDPGRAFGLALQVLDPDRLATPPGKSADDRLVSGIELNEYGGPIAYHIADPQPGRSYFSALASGDFRRIPAKLAHRPNVFHGYTCREPEQIRGVSVLAPLVKYLKHLDDYLDYELIGAIMAAAFSVFVEDQNQTVTPGVGVLPTGQPADATGDKPRYAEVEPGLIMYGGPGEKPHILESKRPSSSAETFIRTILRTVSSATGIPYVALMKDYEKTSFSSARAALNEAYRVYQVHRHWLVDHFCQPIWGMFAEECVLRGYVQIPGGLNAFYAARPAWTACDWIGPPRLSVDPKKEMEANQIAISNKLASRARIIAESTGADWEDELQQISREEQFPGPVRAGRLSPGPQRTNPGQRLRR